MSDEPRLTHVDDQGRARMVDVGGKSVSDRVAIAEGLVHLAPGTAEALFGGQLAKGDAIATARIAAIMAAKRTAELIPLCHPIMLSGIEVDISRVDAGARIEAAVRTTERTGVEMEAMTAVSVAALTLYDMVKGIERGVTIGPVRLLQKRGGRSGTWTAPE